MGQLVKFSGALLLLLIFSGLGTAIGSILHKKAVWIPSLILLVLACAASLGLLILIGQMD